MIEKDVITVNLCECQYISIDFSWIKKINIKQFHISMNLFYGLFKSNHFL